MAVSVRYEELKTEREKLLKRVNEIDKTLEDFEKEVIKGKFNKAIRLLRECDNYLYDSDIEVRCPKCDEEISFSYEDVVSTLEKLGKDCGL